MKTFASVYALGDRSARAGATIISAIAFSRTALPTLRFPFIFTSSLPVVAV
jgi:hypothetical protein